MEGRVPKYSFFILSAILLVLMVGASRNAGVTCDEVLHYDHSVAVYNYFATHGKDISALNTPETHLKYYGQSYDNLVTILIRWLKIDDVYYFRHIMSAIAGWVTIIVTAFFAVWLSDYRSGIIVILLFAVSPTFLGHSQNNLKDIPFALGYVSSIFFIMRVLFPHGKRSYIDVGLLVVSIAFAISIRAGGIILICYLFFLFFLIHSVNYLKERNIDFNKFLRDFLMICGISILSFFLGILLWPYALQNPVKNVFESYYVMAHFPATFRQIFEGKEEWSDYMPWYYLIKSMVITIPLAVAAGWLIFAVYSKRIFSVDSVKTGMIVFTVLFPIIFVTAEGSNLYSSWRQFLFVYPGIILVSAIGFTCLFRLIRNKYLAGALLVSMILMSIHPLRYMASNQPYWYIYYNQFVGGLKGAYGHYDTDYYYVSQTEASDWLINYLEQKGETSGLKINATYSVQWAFANILIKTAYFRYDERACMTGIMQLLQTVIFHHLNLRIMASGNSIHIVYADSVPICAVLELNDFYGSEALNRGKIPDAIRFFEYALEENDKDEMISFNFASALIRDGQAGKADSVLREGLKVNPDCEMILMYLGNMAKSQQKPEEAKKYYEKLISVNRKYFDAYVELSRLLVSADVLKSREVLRNCLKINPRFKPALIALADTYRNSDPEVAEKYDNLANKIEN
jgi:tetratricopeptide (TPR) repeat protein